MHCKTEKSTRTVVALQVVQAFLYFIAFAIVLTAAGLFSRALSHFNSMIEGRDVCLLFKADQMTNPSPFICYGAIAIEALAGVGLMILVIVSILKIALKMMKLVKKSHLIFCMPSDHFCLLVYAKVYL